MADEEIAAAQADADKKEAELLALVDKLQKSNPGAELIQLKSPAGVVIAKVPGPIEVAELRNRMGDKRSGGATEWFVRTCIIYPSNEVLNLMVKRRPFLIEKWYQKLEVEAGSAEEIEVRKF